MALTITINAVDKTSLYLAGSLGMSEKLDQRITATFRLADASYAPVQGQPVIISDGVTTHFKGVIQKIKRKLLNDGANFSDMADHLGISFSQIRQDLGMTMQSFSAATAVVNGFLQAAIDGNGVGTVANRAAEASGRLEGIFHMADGQIGRDAITAAMQDVLQALAGGSLADIDTLIRSALGRQGFRLPSQTFEELDLSGGPRASASSSAPVHVAIELDGDVVAEKTFDILANRGYE